MLIQNALLGLQHVFLCLFPPSLLSVKRDDHVG